MKILLVSSVGGHLTEMMQLAPQLKDHDVSLVVNDRTSIPNFPFRNVYRIVHAERDWRVAVNFLEAAQILATEQPDVILSSGAGPAVPFVLLARALTDAKIVYVDCAAAVEKLTVTGRMVYPFAHSFFVQWKGLASRLRRARFAPLLF